VHDESENMLRGMHSEKLCVLGWYSAEVLICIDIFELLAKYGAPNDVTRLDAVIQKRIFYGLNRRDGGLDKL
jgi:hypothetical protein